MIPVAAVYRKGGEKPVLHIHAIPVALRLRQQLQRPFSEFIDAEIAGDRVKIPQRFSLFLIPDAVDTVKISQECFLRDIFRCLSVAQFKITIAVYLYFIVLLAQVHGHPLKISSRYV